MPGDKSSPVLRKPVIAASNLSNFVVWYVAQGGDPGKLDLPAPLSVFNKPSAERWYSCIQHNRLQYSIIENTPGFTLDSYFDIGKAALYNKRLGIHRMIAKLVPEKDFIAKQKYPPACWGVEQYGEM